MCYKRSRSGTSGLCRPRRPTKEAPILDLPLPAAIFIIFLLVVSLSIHEAAHGWVAWKCGDPTAKELGRITLNPIPHIDPFMTILLPAFLLLSGSSFLFGGARPVPVNGRLLRRPLRDMMLVALAGPLSNLGLAVVFVFLRKLFLETGLQTAEHQMIVILEYAAFFNILLAVFNLLPIPPLDGSRVLAWMLPTSVRGAYVSLERIGMILIFALLLSGLLHGVLFDGIRAVWGGVYWLVSLGGVW